MLDLDEWRARAQDPATCIAMPATITQISDSFIVIERLAPDFDGVQRAVAFPVSMDMMFGVLMAAVDRLATRCKRDDGRAACLGSLGLLGQALADFRGGDRELGRLRTRLARHRYREGAVPRSRITELEAARGVMQCILAHEREAAAASR